MIRRILPVGRLLPVLLLLLLPACTPAPPEELTLAEKAMAIVEAFVTLAGVAKTGESPATAEVLGAIRQAMFSGQETTVQMKEKRPVRISYFTAWVDGDRLLNFREDVYGHDERLARELFR